MIDYVVREGRLVVNERVVSGLPNSVGSVAAFDDALVVCTAPLSFPARNVYGVDEHGLVRWQVALPKSRVGAFLGVNRGERGRAVAIHDIGAIFELEPRTGRVLQSYLTK